ncbi:hemerythrin domain-containing protein [Patescibacteria group bacterium]|nr:hemerythrin domain-containing protein [Patescibacteria group bacterium]
MKNQKPTDILKKDHKVISDIIKILEACANSLEEGGKCDLDILNGSMNLIKNFTHKYHRRTEESVLFKIAEKKAAPWGARNISSMLREHEEGAEQVRRVADLLRESVSGGISSKKSKKAVIKNIYAYSFLLGSHLMQEEKILYPTIESLLASQERKNIMKSFERLNYEMSEVGDKDRYRNLIKKYKEKLGI